MSHVSFACAVISAGLLAAYADNAARSGSDEITIASQTPSAAASDSKADLVTVRGCLHGLVMTTVDETGTNAVAPRQFRLTGDRRVLDGSGGTHGGEKRVGKGRVYGGTTEAPFQQPGVVDQPEISSTLLIEAFTHIADRCS